MKVKIIYKIALIALITSLQLKAQLYPAQAFFNLSPPFPVYLSDYANPTSNNLSVKLLFRDFNVGTRSVRLKFSIQGSNFQASNLIQNTNLPEFSLTAGQPLLLTQADIFPYFLSENLDIPPAIYGQAIPEGVYTFGVEIIDVLSNRAISGRLSSVPYWFTVNEPPIINLPINGSKVMVTNPQNVLFQWTPRNKQAASMEYEFTLTELIEPENFEGNLQQIFFSQPPYFQTSTNNTTLLYGPGEPPLIENRFYAARIQAKAKKGLEQIGIFNNNGFSEIITFQYKNPISQLVQIQEAITDKITINTDKENYLTADLSNIIKQYQYDFLQKAPNKVLNNYKAIGKKLNLNDTLKIGDLIMNVGSNKYVNVAISIPDFGTKAIKLYFNDSLSINSKNEIAFGGLNLYPTNNVISLRDSTKGKNVNLNLVNNKSSFFGGLLLLEEAKAKNNNAYHEIRALAMKSPNEIREINLKLNAYLAFLKDKATLMEKILKNYSGNIIFKEVSDKIVLEEKQTKSYINNLQEFLRKYDSYYKADYAQLLLKHFPDEPSNLLEQAFYNDLMQNELDNLLSEKEKEKIRLLKILDDEYQRKLGVLGAFPANMNAAELKQLEDKMDEDVLKLGVDMDKKYDRLQNEVIKKYQLLNNKLEKK
jgi:hypothetical protein